MPYFILLKVSDDWLRWLQIWAVDWKRMGGGNRQSLFQVVGLYFIYQKKKIQTI